MIRALLASLLVATSVGAAMDGQVPVVEPASSLIDAHAPRVVTSEIGMYLAGGQRVTANGVVVDDQPIPFAEGHAAGWKDGWLVVSQYEDKLIVRHLGATGATRLVTVIPRAGERMQGVASASGSLAILEIGRYPENELILTVTDTREVLHRQVIDVHARDGVVARMGDGFIVAWWSQELQNLATLSVTKLDASGVRVGSRVFDRPASVPPNPLRLVTSETHAVVLWSTFSTARYRVVDGALEPRAFKLVGGGGIVFQWGIDLGGSEGFFISYRRLGKDRAHIVRPDGEVVSDVLADPVSGGDRIGNRYFVTRPWGHGAVADGDPRAIVGPAIQLRRRVYERWDHLLSVVSGDVTLVRFGRALAIDWFVRIDGDGKAIDPSRRRIPSISSQDLVTIPIADGFAFAWFDGDEIRYQRLSRRGDWLDAEPITLPVSTGGRSFALHANDEDLLIAWTTPGELRWMRLTHGGETIDAVPRQMGFAASRSSSPRGVSIAGNGPDRLLSLLSYPVCTITCEPAEPAPFIVGVLTIDRDASPIGAPMLTDSEGLRVVGLPDGTWVMPARRGMNRGPEVFHIDRDGSIIARIPMPLLSSYDLWDAAPTPSGWRAIVPGPSRFVEFDGAASPSRVTGLTTAMPTRFAAGDRLAFLDGSLLHESAVPWTGRVSPTDGDYSVATTDLGATGAYRRVLVTVSNKAESDVTNVVVFRATADGRTVTIPLLRSGEVHQFMGEVMPDNYVWPVVALSPDVTDTNPSDNWSSFAMAELPGERQHPVRR